MEWQEIDRIDYIDASRSAEIVWNAAAAAATWLDKGEVITEYLRAVAMAGPGRRQSRG